MPGSQDQGPGTYSLALFALALLLFFSPFAVWWASQRPSWYIPYLLWLLVTVLSALLARRLRRHDV
ncbi:UTP--glucose-1-phosphate uridylyltransferase [Ectothiorhodospiraceae bacterium WFHF3C12]|nr:UTP--glucose-1-phosphate uridylyltransferase [Ectothiorhodospiraceae bacterium WFHF3C12]